MVVVVLAERRLAEQSHARSCPYSAVRLEGGMRAFGGHGSPPLVGGHPWMQYSLSLPRIYD